LNFIFPLCPTAVPVQAYRLFNATTPNLLNAGPNQGVSFRERHAALLERYMKFFAAVRGESDHANPHYPFFHLKAEGFWHLQALPARACGAYFR